MDLLKYYLIRLRYGVKNYFPFLTSPLAQAAAPWKGLSHVPEARGHPFQGVETVVGDVNKYKITFYTIYLLLPLLYLPAYSQTTELRVGETLLKAKVVLKHLEIPWDMHWAPDGWIWFSEKRGKISRVQPVSGLLQEIHFVDEVFQSDDNSGMHALALHPDFLNQPYVYVHYTYELQKARLVRFTFNPKSLALEDRIVLLDELRGHASHNGSRIVFSEDQQYMYFSLGDAFMSGKAQDLDDYAGKILRMKPDGSVPEDNPLPNSLIWSYGHRNPQGLVLAPNGKLYSSEHGGGGNDELNLIEKGKNFGWPHVKGYCDRSDEWEYCDQNEVIYPLYTWDPSFAVCAIEFYDHEAIPEWRNSILQASLKGGMGQYGGQRLQQFKLNPEGDSILEVNDYFTYTFGRLREVMAAPDGRVFLFTSNQELNGNGSKVVKWDDDKMIMIYNPEVHKSVNSLDATNLVTIYPNPTSRDFVVYFPFDRDIATFRLIDIHGRTLWTKHYVLDQTAINIRRGDYAAGMYHLEIRLQSGEVSTHKLVLK